jgi:hypothetical protein
MKLIRLAAWIALVSCVGCATTTTGGDTWVTPDVPEGSHGTVTASETQIGSFEVPVASCLSMPTREYFTGVDMRSSDGTLFVRFALEPLDGPGLLVEHASTPNEALRLSRENCSTLESLLGMNRTRGGSVQSYGFVRFDCAPASGGAIRGNLTFNCW